MLIGSSGRAVLQPPPIKTAHDVDRGVADSEPTAGRDTLSPALDDETFERLSVQLHGPLARLIQRLLGWQLSDREVEDVLQEVYLAAWARRHRFRGDSKAETWLTRIAINKARSYRRARRAASGLLIRLMIHRQNEPESSELPSAGMVRDESVAAVRKAIGLLSPADREVLVLRYLEERSISEIAELLRLNRNAVDARLSRARRRMEKKLADLGVRDHA